MVVPSRVLRPMMMSPARSVEASRASIQRSNARARSPQPPAMAGHSQPPWLPKYELTRLAKRACRENDAPNTPVDAAIAAAPAARTSSPNRVSMTRLIRSACMSAAPWDDAHGQPRCMPHVQSVETSAQHLGDGLGQGDISLGPDQPRIRPRCDLTGVWHVPWPRAGPRTARASARPAETEVDNEVIFGQRKLRDSSLFPLASSCKPGAALARNCSWYSLRIANLLATMSMARQRLSPR